MASNAALQKKALAAGTKSEGMRMLLDAGDSVAEVKEIFGAPYGFVYGVAKRNGSVSPTARAPRAAKAEKAATRPARTAKAKASAKAPARTAKTAAKPAARKSTRAAK